MTELGRPHPPTPRVRATSGQCQARAPPPILGTCGLTVLLSEPICFIQLTSSQGLLIGRRSCLGKAHQTADCSRCSHSTCSSRRDLAATDRGLCARKRQDPLVTMAGKRVVTVPGGRGGGSAGGRERGRETLCPLAFCYCASLGRLLQTLAGGFRKEFFVVLSSFFVRSSPGSFGT